MGTPPLQFFCHLRIVSQCVFILFRVRDIPCITQCCLCDLILVQHFIHGDFHSRDPVQGVKDSEYIYSASCFLFYKFPDQVVGIVGISHRICTAQQHLEGNIGYFFPEQVKAFPRRFLQKTVGHIKGGTAPHFQ